MTGTHGRDRPVLADDGGVAVHTDPSISRITSVMLEPPTARSAVVSYSAGEAKTGSGNLGFLNVTLGIRNSVKHTNSWSGA
jgi:hypothetical protein